MPNLPFWLTILSVLCDNIVMAITWNAAADKHRIPREEALYAMFHAHAVVHGFGAPRPGFSVSPTLFIGPSRYGTLEVLVILSPPEEMFIFHVMLLRASTAQAAEYEGEGS